MALGQNNYSNVLSRTEVEPTLKRWELRTAPIAFIAAWKTLDVAYRLTNHWSLGPSAISYGCELGNMLGPCYNGDAVGLNLNYYFKSVEKDTWYISTHAYSEKFKSYPEGSLGYSDVYGSKLNSALGYQWKGKMIQILLGLGFEIRNYNIDEKYTDPMLGNNKSYSDSESLPFIEFKIGIEI
jgi:hypothetical protein